MAFLPASMMMCRIVLPSFLRLRLKSVRPPPRMYTSFISLYQLNQSPRTVILSRDFLGSARAFACTFRGLAEMLGIESSRCRGRDRHQVAAATARQALTRRRHRDP